MAVVCRIPNEDNLRGDKQTICGQKEENIYSESACKDRASWRCHSEEEELISINGHKRLTSARSFGTCRMWLLKIFGNLRWEDEQGSTHISTAKQVTSLSHATFLSTFHLLTPPRTLTPPHEGGAADLQRPAAEERRLLLLHAAVHLRPSRRLQTLCIPASAAVLSEPSSHHCHPAPTPFIAALALPAAPSAF